MKPTNRQLELIHFCKNIISTWENTNDINSLTHYNDMMDFVNTDLNEYPNRIKDGIYNYLSGLLDIIRKL